MWKFHWPVTIYKNSTAVTILTAATSRCLLASLNFPIMFYRKLCKTTFEAYTVRNHVWTFHCPMACNSWKKSTVAKMLAAVVCTYIISYYLVKLSCLVKFFLQSSHLRLFSKLWTLFICLLTLSSLLNLFKQYLHSILLSPSILSLSQLGTNIIIE